MARPNRSDEKRRVLVPRLARAFAELGYRRTTTAELARRCRAPENTLYRLWADKRAMFIAAIRYVFDLSEQTWRRLSDIPSSASAAESTSAERVLAHESVHQGEFSHYRILFAGLSEADDPEIRAALADTYRHFAHFLKNEIAGHRSQCHGTSDNDLVNPTNAAWALVGLGTMVNVMRELGLATAAERTAVVAGVGGYLLDGRATRSPVNPKQRARRRALKQPAE